MGVGELYTVSSREHTALCTIYVLVYRNRESERERAVMQPGECTRRRLRTGYGDEYIQQPPRVPSSSTPTLTIIAPSVIYRYHIYLVTCRRVFTDRYSSSSSTDARATGGCIALAGPPVYRSTLYPLPIITHRQQHQQHTDLHAPHTRTDTQIHRRR